MTSQVIFKIDKKIKDQAMKKAKQEGITFSYYLKWATEAYINNVAKVSFTLEPQVNEKTKKELLKISKDIKAGRNLVGPFKTVHEMKNYLLN